MRLIHGEYAMDIILKENTVAVIIVENRKVYAELIQELMEQIKGQSGRYVLTDKEKELSLSKNLTLIFNPFEIDCNERKVIQRLYQEVEEVATGDMITRTTEIHSAIIEYLDELLAIVPYQIGYTPDLNVLSWLKAVNVEIDSEDTSLLERVTNYVRVHKRLLHIHVFIFINIHLYMDKEDLQKLYEFACYEKIYLILFESMQNEYVEGERVWLLDKDLCIIEMNLQHLSKCALGENLGGFEV